MARWIGEVSDTPVCGGSYLQLERRLFFEPGLELRAIVSHEPRRNPGSDETHELKFAVEDGPESTFTQGDVEQAP